MLSARVRGLAALALPLALLVAGCGKPKAAKEGGPVDTRQVYRFALTSDIKGFDPINANDVPTARVLGAVHETLLQYAYLERPYRVEPCLTDGMPVASEDGKKYTFTLKKGVFFHDDPAFGGKPRELVAEDFVYSWKRLAHKKNHANGWWVLDGWIEGLNEWRDAEKGYDEPVSGLVAKDRYTFEVTLTRPYPQFFYVLTMVYTAPTPREAVEKYGEDFLNKCIGTGAFTLKEMVRSSRIVLVKNPKYRHDTYPTTGTDWAREKGLLADAGKKLPFLDEIVYEIINESQPAWLKFISGKLDRNGIPKDNFDSVMVSKEELGGDLAKKGIQLQIQPSQTLWWIGFNVKDPLFQGEKGRHLRRAIAHSHDAVKFIRVLANDRGQPSDAIIPPMLPAYDPEAITEDLGYDLDKAAKELELAGFPGGKGAPVIQVDTRGQSSLSRQIAEFMVKDMEKIGLKAEIQTNTFQQFLKKARQGQTQVYWGGWVGDYPDEENWLQLLYGPNGDGGTNYSNYANPEFDALYDQTRVMHDSPERRKLIQKAINIALRDCPWRMSYVATDYVLQQRWLKNFMYGDAIYNWQKYLKIDVADRARGY